ncbi:glycosyltransferase, group 2 family protein [Oribacterium sp. oral taxon 078 str. F0263]|uniref:glycosyltransferase family 2 protein n=1 Tax=Oribacterium sp. oral taxon 078 TaxID=652706 RepID=UPI0003ADCDED|nr:glycosyltransferase family 2 protein [Oribacterium sp. oral taxon 078]ERL22496.1 glycosyltransferase, group 2 family protein [Oribacterium sp. oral taxon 078 str. F0263]
MSESPLISVVIPVYNAARFLRESLSSVLMQSFSDWEILAVDDASTDSSPEILKSFQKESSLPGERFRILRNEKNRGVAFSRNRGVREARGEWIAFLDADDLWEARKLERQLSLLTCSQSESSVPSPSPFPASASSLSSPLLFTASGFLKENGERIPYILEVPERIRREELLKQNLISCSSVLCKRDWLLRFPMPEQTGIHEDFAVWLQILSETPFALGLNEPLLLYRVSSSSKSGNKLRAAKMNWRTYRYLGLSPLRSLLLMAHYSFRNLKKWRTIRRAGKKAGLSAAENSPA